VLWLGQAGGQLSGTGAVGRVQREPTTHEAWGLGVYSVFICPDVGLTRAIETPRTPEVRFHEMIMVALGDHGGISHVIDDTGEETTIRPRVAPKVRDFP
jgi:hypothetical protein